MYIKEKLSAFNNMARFHPLIALTDLDQRECPVLFHQEWITFDTSPNFLFRIAVREVETWLLADRQGFAGFLGISKDKIPLTVEDVLDPKQLVCNLANNSRKRSIKEGLVPRGSAKQGPEHNALLGRFIDIDWDLDQACLTSPSLHRAVLRIEQFNPLIEE